MAVVPATDWVVAEMVTNDYIWRGAGHSTEAAREALLRAWTAHRAAVLRQQPQLAGTLPEAPQMPTHFAIRYQCYSAGAGYRDGERLT